MGRFSSFVIVAEMRTGSNLLEASLASLRGVHGHGELFNPAFVGQPKRHEAFGIDEDARERDPAALLAAMTASGPGLHGFRWFRDHDSRVPDIALADPGCAILWLTRNPVDCYVSRKIARATGQWRLGDLADRKSAKAWFDAEEFSEYLSVRDIFARNFRHRLQTAGRTAFELRYEDLGDLRVLNGLAAWLGVEARLGKLPTRWHKQNPGALSERVENHEEMLAALAAMGLGEAGEDEAFRTRLGAAIPRYLVAAQSPLVYQPVPGGPVGAVSDWLTRLDGAPPETGYRWNAFRDWMLASPGHRAFTVIRHPLLRAFHAFQDHLAADPERRATLAPVLARYGVDLPPPDAQPPRVRQAFIAWLEFVAGALAGQTSVRPDPLWLPQIDHVQGFGAGRPPDLIVREDEMETVLPALTGTDVMPGPVDRALVEAAQEIVTPRIEKLVRRVYRRDFRTFGFGGGFGPSGGL